jgi:hypothetical protein
MVRPSQVGIVPRSRLLLLFGLFFFICCGLGYPSLNRVDWRKAPGGLDDVRVYAAMVAGQPADNANDHMKYRVMVPSLARPIYRAAINHSGTWDPIMLGLLVVDSFFVSATVMVLLVVVCRALGSYTVGLGAALIYLLNFAVPNLRLSGFIDAGEGFFLMLLVWSLWEERYWTLPVWGVVGATAKESFVPFLIVFTLAWWLCSRKTMCNPTKAAAWIAASWLGALASMSAVQWKISGAYQSPLRFGLGLHQNTAYFSHFITSLSDRNLWYIFFWLLPLSLFRLKRLPLNWRVATATTSVTAFALDAYYGGPPGAIGRALFSVAGPLLSASVTILLFGGIGVDREPVGEASGAIKAQTARAGN